jgi:eukaryotic-like serine/threonine-protein kinase
VTAPLAEKMPAGLTEALLCRKAMPEPSRSDRIRPEDAFVTQPRDNERTTPEPTLSDSETGTPGSRSSDTGSSDGLMKNLAQKMASTSEHSFRPGQLVAERFKVVRFLARGGMGEVYEADDLRLKERVALKTIRPEVAHDRQAMVRFEREIRLARKVSHPNVCRVFDLQTHREGSQEVTFLSMELLTGQTLSEHLRARGRLGEPEALPLVRQMCAALGAAHEAGVVHRDFKSGNVLLCGPGQTKRVVVTDFGLAQRRGTAGEESETSVTAAGKLVGTPAYMAPEQLEGRELTAATDLYALGLVMYEMLTGKLPFRGDTPQANLLRRVKEPAPSPRALVPELSPWWEAAILRCLEREPRKRFQSAAELLEALEARGPRRRSSRRLVLGTLAGVLALGLAGGVVLYLSGQHQSVASSSAGMLEPRRTVAVLGFKNLSGRAETEWVSTALSEMLAAELAAEGQLRTIPGENVLRMKRDLALETAESYGQETLSRIRLNLGSDLVVLGSYLALGEKGGGKLRLDLRLQDAVAGETLATLSETASENELFELVSRTGAGLRGTLGVGERTAEQADSVRGSLPTNPAAARLYVEGLAKHRLWENLAAQALLEKAVSLEPDFAPARAVLAEISYALRYLEKARAEARKALELATGLPKHERLAVEARAWRAMGEGAKALEIYQELFEEYPDHLEYGLWLADAQLARQPKAALATLAALRKLPAPAGDDPQIDVLESRVRKDLADWDRALAAVARATDKAQARGARAVLAEAQSSKAQIHWCRRELDQAIAAFAVAGPLYTALGDRGSAANVLCSISSNLEGKGDWTGARRKAEECLQALRELADPRAALGARHRLAYISAKQGMLAEALEAFEELAADYAALGTPGEDRWLSRDVYRVLWAQGDMAAARRSLDEALAIAREDGAPTDLAAVLVDEAEMLVRSGKLSEAAKKLDEAEALAPGEQGPAGWQWARLLTRARILEKRGELAALRSAGEQAVEAGRGALYAEDFSPHVLALLANADRSGGDLDAARMKTEEALRTWSNYEKWNPPFAELRLASVALALEEGRLPEAEEAARKLLEELRTQGRLGSQAAAQALLAQALLARKRPEEARTALDGAAGLAQRSEELGILLSVQITAARVQAASGTAQDVGAAIQSLQTALAQAHEAGFLGEELEARLALGEVEVSSDLAAEGRERLAALERDAEARDFLLIARKAAKARD